MTLTIVGNSFFKFADGDGVLTEDDATRRLLSDGGARIVPGTHVVLSQGIPRTRVSGLLRQFRQLGCLVTQLARATSPAPRRLAHKHRDENVLVSAPQRIASDEYQLNLLVDERCAELADHVTGRHLPGMLLVEAARQACLVVHETFYADLDTPDSASVMDSMAFNFRRFLFPLEVRLTLRVRRAANPLRATVRYDVDVDIGQPPEPSACQVRIGFVSYPKERLDQLEAQAAFRALAACAPMKGDAA